MSETFARNGRLPHPVRTLLAPVFIFTPGVRAHSNGELR